MEAPREQAQAQAQDPSTGQRLDNQDIYQSLIDGLDSATPGGNSSHRVVQRTENMSRIVQEEPVSYQELHREFRNVGYENSLRYLNDYAQYMMEQESTQQTLVSKLQDIPAITSEEEEIYI